MQFLNHATSNLRICIICVFYNFPRIWNTQITQIIGYELWITQPRFNWKEIVILPQIDQKLWLQQLYRILVELCRNVFCCFAMTLSTAIFSNRRYKSRVSKGIVQHFLELSNWKNTALHNEFCMYLYFYNLSEFPNMDSLSSAQDNVICKAMV